MKRGSASLRRAATFVLHGLTRPWRPRTSPPLDPPHSILAIELARMGDAVVGTHALRALRRAFPAAEITYAVEEPWAGLFGPPVAHRVIAGQESHGPRGFAELVRAIRRRRYDLALNLSPSVRNTAVLLFSRARCRAGYLDLRSSLTPFRDRHTVLTLGIAPRARVQFGPRMGIAKRSVRVLLALGILPDGLDPEVSLPREAICAAEGIVGNRVRCPLICLHPGSGWGPRRWPAGRWSALATELAVKRGCLSALLGSESERALLSEVAASAASAEPLVLCGLPVPVLAAVLARSSAFVGCDSGPLHLAVALRMPAVGLFGPAPPRETAPSTVRLRSLHVPRACCPCDQTECLTPAESCLDRISVDQVLRALEELGAIPPPP